MAKAKSGKVKGKRIFKIAKEFNLSHKTLTEFLQKKGYKVSGPNDTVTEEMHEKILARFSEEKAKAEKIRARKIVEEQASEESVAAESAADTSELAPEKTVDEAQEKVAEPVAEEKDVKTEEAEPVKNVADIIAESEKQKRKTQEMPAAISEPEVVAPAETEPEKQEKEEEPEAKRIPEIIEDEKVTRDIPKKDKKKPMTDKDKRKDKDNLSAKERKRKKAFDLIKKENKKYKHKFTPSNVKDVEEQEDVKLKAGRIGRPKKRKKKEKNINQQEVADTLKKTLANMGSTNKRKKKKKVVKEDGVVEEVNVIVATEFMSVQELAKAMEIDATEVIKTCMSVGILATINQRLDMETIKIIADEFNFEVEEAEVEIELMEEIIEEEEDVDKMIPRAPIVTIMGHVDHGKTSLLDYIRSTNVVSGESGGITQHIGAYEVELSGRGNITFLDTPGHEAFTAMRARGAQVTDIVVLVVAADDRVMPQTNEAIDHALAAGVSIIIAINKVDKPNANPEKIKKELADRNILVEDWGGKYQCVEVSAKTGHNVEELLEKILLEAEMLELKANPDKSAIGTVIESRLDKGKGPVATVLIQSGTLRVGNFFVAGANWGKVRAMLNEREMRIIEAGPSTPVQVLGFDGVPQGGDKFIVMDSEQRAREIAVKRQQIRREQELRVVRKISLEQFSQQIQQGEVKELNVLIKSDVAGSSQALADSISKLSTPEVRINIVRSAVGPITESDVLLAAASNAVLIGFHVRPNVAAKELANNEHVEIRLYKIIYDVVEDLKNALEGMLAPIEREVVVGTVEVREVFKISKVGSVAGCYVTSGKIYRNSRVRLVRNDVEIYDGELASLKRFKEDVKEVASGFECGIMIKNYNDIKVGDTIEAYETIEEKQTLEGSRKK